MVINKNKVSAVLPAGMAIFLLFFISCNLPDVTNYASLYRIQEAGKPEISFRLFHANDTASFLHYRIKAGRNYGTGQHPDADTINYFRLEYILYQAKPAGLVIDSSSVICRFHEDSLFTGFLPFKYPGNIDYEIYLRLIDVKGDRAVMDKYRFAKETGISQNDFLVFDDKGQVVYDRQLTEGIDFYVVSGTRHDLSGEFILLKPRKVFPDPPFVQHQETDILFDIFTLKESNHLDTTSISTGKDQLLCFSPAKGIRRIPITFIASGGFPEVLINEVQIDAMRYLLTDIEYTFLTGSESKEIAINEFWLMAGGSEARSMTLKRQYFDRVSEANRLFTTYKTGWSTDRGMIYCVLGSPDQVYRGKNVETWKYTGIDQGADLTFDFRNQEIFPGIFELILQRDVSYLGFWMEKVALLRR